LVNEKHQAPPKGNKTHSAKKEKGEKSLGLDFNNWVGQTVERRKTMTRASKSVRGSVSELRGNFNTTIRRKGQQEAFKGGGA